MDAMLNLNHISDQSILTKRLHYVVFLTPLCCFFNGWVNRYKKQDPSKELGLKRDNYIEIEMFKIGF